MRALIVALCLGLGACSGAQKTEPTGTEAATERPVDPTAEDLEKCPCGDGSPDWSRLPEGSDPAEPE